MVHAFKLFRSVDQLLPPMPFRGGRGFNVITYCEAGVSTM